MHLLLVPVPLYGEALGQPSRRVVSTGPLCPRHSDRKIRPTCSWRGGWVCLGGATQAGVTRQKDECRASWALCPGMTFPGLFRPDGLFRVDLGNRKCCSFPVGRVSPVKWANSSRPGRGARICNRNVPACWWEDARSSPVGLLRLQPKTLCSPLPDPEPWEQKWSG